MPKVTMMMGFLVLLLCSGGLASDGDLGSIVVAQEDAGPRQPEGRVGPTPYDGVSEASLFENLENLTTIRPFAGWRNSASVGEKQAMDLVQARLESMRHLMSRGLQIERQPFHTFSGTDFRDTRVEFVVNGVAIEVPAFGISGHRDYLNRALLFDSDGVVNDNEPDPVVVEGAPIIVRTEADLASLPDLNGQIVIVDFALIDRSIQGWDLAWTRARSILDLNPSGIVPVTIFSNRNGESHGTFAGDLPVWTAFDDTLPPILTIRLEDLDVAGIYGWGDFGRVESVCLTWDMDVFSPGFSENLMARIPGVDHSRAVIIGAHIDSPNSPGGIDDGSGSVVVLEVAQALEVAKAIPPVDLYLVWYGSHERGLYGSSHFIAGHQDLLDRTLAVLQVDCLSVPLDGINPYLNLETWSYGRFGNAQTPWPDYLAGLADSMGVYANPLDYWGLVSDNTNYSAWDVPNANLIFFDPTNPTEVHYAGHMHDPYETVELAQTEAGTVVDMAKTAVAAAMETGREDPPLKVTPAPDRRAVFVASHTESAHMTPTHFIEFGMTLAWEGFDVDMVPYGRNVTSADLEGAEVVIVLPVHDYPSVDGDVDSYDEAFTEPEVDALEAYARGGGFLVLTNSANRLKYYNYVYEANEDWSDLNPLADRFNIEFHSGAMAGLEAVVTATHPLVDGVTAIAMAPDNGVSLTHSSGRVLARLNGETAVLLRDIDDGQVLVLADLGMLSNDGGVPENLRFWRNLAEYAREMGR